MNMSVLLEFFQYVLEKMDCITEKRILKRILTVTVPYRCGQYNYLNITLISADCKTAAGISHIVVA